MHTHESWTLLIVDDGMIRYDLHRHEHGALHRAVTLLPPRFPHNGRAATSAGFRKRVVYLDLAYLPASLIGLAVDRPVLFDPLLRQRIHQLHRALDEPGGELEAESRLAFVAERLRQHLGGDALAQLTGPPEAGPATASNRKRARLPARFFTPAQDKAMGRCGPCSAWVAKPTADM